MNSLSSVTPLEFMDWTWEQIEPHFQALADQPLDAANVAGWLADWSRLAGLVYETYQRLYVAITVDTTDADSKQKYDGFLDEIFPRAQAAEQILKEKLIASGLEVPGFEIPLRNLRLEAALFRKANLPLLAQEMKWSSEYDTIIGDQTIQWNGKEMTITETLPILEDPDRDTRERVWRLGMQRFLADREAINALWTRLAELRGQITRNAGMDSYRDYRWQQMMRFDYTPEDCERFHAAIEQVVVPAANELYERRRRRLGVDRLRPWDLNVDPSGRPPLQPYTEISQLDAGISQIYRQIDPELAGYFDVMRREKLLDLDNRKGKAPGGYCTDFPVTGRPFIFMNGVGIHEDVQTLLHEGGHAFHVFETLHLPYIKQKDYPLEFAEVASTSMELIGAPYFSMPGGFYSPVDAARARSHYLTTLICFWPYMAVVDAFQHWVYTHPQQGADPAACDAQWAELWQRFMPGVDWTGLEDEMVTGWHRKGHIHQVPFYYVEYGLAQLGAFQVWRNALTDLPGAVRAYRRALSLGATAPLPELFRTAGARLAFDTDVLREAVDLGMQTIDELEAIHA